MADHDSTARRCKATTRRGRQCKTKAAFYHLHTDGKEYLCCPLHHTAEFRPVKP